MKRTILLISVVFITKVVVSQSISIDSLNWIIGSWKIDNKTYEIWKKLNDSTLYGVNYYISKENDSIFNEYVKIVKRKENLLFIANVIGQNEGNEVEFVISKKSTVKNLIFENKYHDFPKIIFYTFISKNKLKVAIEGNGKKNEFTFLRLN